MNTKTFDLRLNQLVVELIQTSRRYQLSVPQLLNTKYFQPYKHLESEILKACNQYTREVESLFIQISSVGHKEAA